MNFLTSILISVRPITDLKQFKVEHIEAGEYPVFHKKGRGS